MSEQLTPELRFPEFDGDWTTKSLGNPEVATFFKGKGISKNDIVEDGETPCIRYGELYTEYNEVIDEVKSSTDVPEDELVLSEEFDVIIPASGETVIDIATASCVLKSDIALGGDLNIIRPNTLNGVFLAYYLNNAKKRNIARLAQGISVIHLYKNHLKSLSLNIPEPDEQQKIANFLKAIDKRIKLLKAKKDALEDYKTSIMQKLFAQEIRFKPVLSQAEGQDDGSDASTVLSTSFPEWEEKKINEICKINPRTEKPTDWFFYIDLESVENGNLKEVKFINSKDAPSRAQRVLNKKDLLFQTVRPYQMNNFYFNLDGDYVASTGYAQLRAIQNANFLFYLLHHYQFVIEVLKRSTGTTFPAINTTDLAEIKVKLPSEKEQTKIASFLSEIDKKINATTKFIEASADFKKSLLQKLFV